MRSIYRFDEVPPPFVSEKTLREEAERRRSRRRTVTLALAGALSELCLLLAAAMLHPINAALSYACIAYVSIAISGSAAIAIIFSHKRRSIT
jgi:hypothetical protein